MSHEIRTPMTAILGFTELLASDAEETLDRTLARSRRLGHIQTIRRNGEHLLTIINDILDISKIEAGKMTVESMIFSPVDVIREAMSLMSVKAESKGLSLTVEFASDLPALITSDSLRLRQILVNLMGNAIKFTELGGVRLRVGARPTEERLMIDVIDSGIGMNPEQTTRLFASFEQADTSMSRRFGGTGLGLQISQRLAEMLGGAITVTSTAGEGSTFSLSVATGDLSDATLIPAATLAEQIDRIEPVEVVDAAAESKNPAPLAGLRILFAEDGPDNQRLLSFHLRKSGADVRTVENGRLLVEALTVDGDVDSPLADPPPVDLILSDMQMPEMDGYEAVEMLRAKRCSLPIVALTAHATSGERERCLHAGCDAYASKPITRPDLVQACLRGLGRVPTSLRAAG